MGFLIADISKAMWPIGWCKADIRNAVISETNEVPTIVGTSRETIFFKARNISNVEIGTIVSLLCHCLHLGALLLQHKCVAH